MDISIRNIDDEIIAQIDAMKGSLSREEYLRQRLAEIAEIGEVPQVKQGQGLRGFTETGGAVRLVQYISSVGGGVSNLTQEQFSAYRQAKLFADERNGGDWGKAKKILEAAGLEVYWD